MMSFGTFMCACVYENLCVLGLDVASGVGNVCLYEDLVLVCVELIVQVIFTQDYQVHLVDKCEMIFFDLPDCGGLLIRVGVL